MELPLTPHRFASDEPAPFKVPRAATIIAALPKPATGQVQRYILRGGQPAIARR